ncbi:MAG: hypothetical protein AB1742_07980 [bacterium]
MSGSIEEIRDGGDVLAVIVRSTLTEQGRYFVTPGEYNLQLGVHIRPAGETIPPHVHRSIEGLVSLPIQEFLYLEKGRMKIRLYDGAEKYHSSVELGPGDSILLLRGHSIEFLEDVKIVEIKQGPYYTREKDKRPLKGDS